MRDQFNNKYVFTCAMFFVAISFLSLMVLWAIIIMK
jgi:hypothetical protein